MVDGDAREGLYEDVVTTRLLAVLAARNSTSGLPELTSHEQPVDKAEAPEVLVRHLRDPLLRAFRTRNAESQLDLVRRILNLLDESDEAPDGPIRQLLSLSQAPGPGVGLPMNTSVRPTTPLSDAALLTNSPGDPGLGTELQKELATADRVDLLCAFVKWHGIRVLETQLKQLALRGVPFRIITTTYMGNTEREALDRLADEFGAEIRVQYDALRTRLHAKAWLFRRNSGHDTAYVGSSNLSRAALLDGAEWNVRLSATATPHLLTKFEATFETYWNNGSFEPYTPGADRDRFDDAIDQARGSTRQEVAAVLSGLEVRPYPHQRAILEALSSEREVHGIHRNLVVAATGTGKTVIAALDYKRMCHGESRPRLLFVAHRQEILNQSLRTYREVLTDPTFGEKYVGNSRPERWQHVFASIQSLTAYGITNIPPASFDAVVIDEFHHANARTYRALLAHLTPTELLGLTATPERGDGTDVRELFGGRTAAELRLWDAIDAGLLCPFQYFGISDGTDLTRISWRQGRYDADELDKLYTGNDARTRVILRALHDKVSNVGGMRALGFCVSVAHAEYMASVFSKAGIHALAVSGQTSQADREEALTRLRTGQTQILFAVDLFNEGLDIPDVDTLLLLRPTDSPTIFIQQLGRGLRATQNKAVLTVLDFVGLHRADFRLDQRFAALTGANRRNLERQANQDFPFLPSGCQIVLDEVAQAALLTSIRQHLTVRRNVLANSLRAHPTDALAEFLCREGLNLSDVVHKERSFSEIRRDAGLISAESLGEDRLVRRIRALTHVDDVARATVYRRLLQQDAPTVAQLPADQQRLASMLYFTFFPSGGHVTIDEGLATIRSAHPIADESRQVIEIALDATRRNAHQWRHYSTVPLAVHGQYQREEILAALGHVGEHSLQPRQNLPSHFREGVVCVETEHGLMDAFFITLKKSEKDYSPTTLYADYPISPTLFHWESQSRTTVSSPTGQRYLNGGSTVLLFVRKDRENEFGTAPYTFLGPATYISHTGERPMAITWELENPMPGDLYAEGSVAV